VITPFDDYKDRFETVRLERTDDGILLMTFHTNGGSLRWGAGPTDEMGAAFGAVAQDPENRVVILTGSGEEFNGPKGSPGTFPKTSARAWEGAHWRTRHLVMNFLDIEAPIITALNGPVYRHCETPLMADIVLASTSVVISDSGHFVNGLLPGDGMHIVMDYLLGPTRARYFMLTGQELDAQAALDVGLVSEVLEPDQLLPRAWELARQLNRQSRLLLRYTRVAFVHEIKQRLLAGQGYGILLEGMAAIDSSSDDGYELQARF